LLRVTVLKVGVVGHGYGADVLIPGFRFGPRVDVVAIVGRDAARASAVAEKVGIARAYGDWRQMLDRKVIDAVAIAVPPWAQREICDFALARGIHAFAEKPLASNLADARAMARAAALSSCANVVDFNFREIAAFRAAEDLLRSGAVPPPASWSAFQLESRARLLSSTSGISSRCRMPSDRSQTCNISRPAISLDVTIPVYNEAANILRVLAALQGGLRTPARVLICYDFEEDDTLAAVRLGMVHCLSSSCGIAAVAPMARR
jgi:hypothetical protein